MQYQLPPGLRVHRPAWRVKRSSTLWHLVGSFCIEATCLLLVHKCHLLSRCCIGSAACVSILADLEVAYTSLSRSNSSTN